jgi:DNA-binding transcriptional ArsR family regulator
MSPGLPAGRPNWFLKVDGLNSDKIHLFRNCELLNLLTGMTTLIDVRPLFHPSIDDITVEGILYALSDPVRVAIFADIVAQNCSHNCSIFLTVSDKAIPKSTLSQHFRVLREAGLIRGERRGVEMHNTSRCAEIEQRFPGLIVAIVNAHTIQSKDEARATKAAVKRSPRRSTTNK